MRHLSVTRLGPREKDGKILLSVEFYPITRAEEAFRMLLDASDAEFGQGVGLEIRGEIISECGFVDNNYISATRSER